MRAAGVVPEQRAEGGHQVDVAEGTVQVRRLRGGGGVGDGGVGYGVGDRGVGVGVSARIGYGGVGVGVGAGVTRVGVGVSVGAGVGGGGDVGDGVGDDGVGVGVGGGVGDSGIGIGVGNNLKRNLRKSTAGVTGIGVGVSVGVGVGGGVVGDGVGYGGVGAGGGGVVDVGGLRRGGCASRSGGRRARGWPGVWGDGGRECVVVGDAAAAPAADGGRYEPAQGGWRGAIQVIAEAEVSDQSAGRRKAPPDASRGSDEGRGRPSNCAPVDAFRIGVTRRSAIEESLHVAARDPRLPPCHSPARDGQRVGFDGRVDLKASEGQ